MVELGWNQLGFDWVNLLGNLGFLLVQVQVLLQVQVPKGILVRVRNRLQKPQSEIEMMTGMVDRRQNDTLGLVTQVVGTIPVAAVAPIAVAAARSRVISLINDQWEMAPAMPSDFGRMGQNLWPYKVT